MILILGVPMFADYVPPQDLRPSDPRFGSGPSLIPVSFVEALLKTGTGYLGTSHRKPAVKNVVKEMQDGLRQYFNVPTDYEIVLGNGGATLLFDMIALGLVRKRITHFTCGEFSQKWFKSSKLVPWIEAHEVSVPVGEGINGENDPASDVIAITLNETSTGVITSKIPEVDNDTLLAVDATSGGGQVPCNISKTDMFFFSPQKVFASEGGFFVAIMSPKAIARAREIATDKSRYIPEIMSFVQAIDNSTKNQTYNTPSLTSIFFLNEQVKLMIKFGGYQRVIEEANRKALLVYSWAEEKPYLSAYVKNKEFRSQAVATINVDEKVPVDGLIERLEQLNWVYGIDAYRKLGKNQFRISLFHNVTYADLEKLTKLLSHAIESRL
jgi:phosphoserine aminotransferase